MTPIISDWISVITKLPPELELVDVKQVSQGFLDNANIWPNVHLVNGKWADEEGSIDMVEFWRPHVETWWECLCGAKVYATPDEETDCECDSMFYGPEWFLMPEKANALKLAKFVMSNHRP